MAGPPRSTKVHQHPCRSPSAAPRPAAGDVLGEGRWRTVTPSPSWSLRNCWGQPVDRSSRRSCRSPGRRLGGGRCQLHPRAAGPHDRPAVRLGYGAGGDVRLGPSAAAAGCPAVRVTGRWPGGSAAPRPTWPVNLPGTAPAGAETGEGKPEQGDPPLTQAGTPVVVAGGMVKNNERHREGSWSLLATGRPPASFPGGGMARLTPRQGRSFAARLRREDLGCRCV